MDEQRIRKIIREEMHGIKNFVTLSPTINVTVGDIKGSSDVDEVIRGIIKAMEREALNSDNNVYGCSDKEEQTGTINQKDEYPEGIDIAYDLIRTLKKLDVTAEEAERILDEAKAYIKKYARLSN